jgi:hypothetical protein
MMQVEMGNLVKRPFNMCRVGKKVETSLAEVELTPSSAPCSILFPASHGFGLAFTLLIQVWG